MNKRYLIFILLFILVFDLKAQQNLLKNPGFEENSGPSGKKFAYWETWGGDVYEVWNKDSHYGKYSAKFWWSGGIYQEFAVNPGEVYELSAWLSTPMSEPLDMNGTKSAIVELQFLSSKQEIISTKRSDPFNNKKDIGEWYEFKVRDLAPPNASYVRATIEFVGGEGGGVICFDDASLVKNGNIDLSTKFFDLNLESIWFINKGDDSKWKKIDYDDSAWEKINTLDCIQSVFPEYHGFVWYRYHFIIPNDMQGIPLFLLLGTIEDADETFFNGNKIGSGGGMPPSFQSVGGMKRQYVVPADIIQYGKDNVFAIRVYDSTGRGGIMRRPIRICSAIGLKDYFQETELRASQLGKPISLVEINKLKQNSNPPKRCKIKALANGGWTFVLPDNQPFMPIGTEYEPLAMYGEMKWDLIERDIKFIKAIGFNTFTVWCMDFNGSQGSGVRMTIDEMVKLADLAKKNNLFIQFYLNLDRFIQLFPTATLPNGQSQGYDIDYYDPGYLEFCRNFAKRLAAYLYTFNNVSTIVVWEEKIGLNIDWQEKRYVQSFFGSKWGKAAFRNWLIKKHGTIQNLNLQWGTSYASFEDAINFSLLDFYNGVTVNDHRQYDILEFGEIMLIDFTKNFVDAYKSIDPTMLFQCRNWDLFGPVRTVDPRYSFLDSFGVNNYAFGDLGQQDMTLREEIIKMKIVAGVVGKAPYVSNFGFRAKSWDGASHGLVPNEDIKASLAADSSAAFSFLPEMSGTSYFTYFFQGREGPFGLLKNINGEPLPICDSFKAIHSLISKCNEEIADADYSKKPEVYIFHGLDAIYDLLAITWLEHTTMGWDLSDMKLNYGVITDTDDFSPLIRPIIVANFHVYDRKIDVEVVKKLINYCQAGGTLVIGNDFGKYTRYLWPNAVFEKELSALKGIKTSDLKTGKIKVIFSDKKYNIPDVDIPDTWYVNADYEGLDANTKVLLDIEVNGTTQPGLICHSFGKGKVYYFLFNPYFHQGWAQGQLANINKYSLPVLYYLYKKLGVNPDTNFGNRGFNLKNGRINVHEKPLHHFNFKYVDGFGTNKDEYGEDNENYSGGVITDKFISFRGHQLNERGWEIKASGITSIYICIAGNSLNYCTSEPVELIINKGDWHITQMTEKYKIYSSVIK